MNAFDTIIVGCGCAALKCADELSRLGRKSFAILVDKRENGTSRNAGSDKQTYYKLTLSGFEGDSVGEMAETLFSGGCVDGPNALCEAALSASCFYRLCELGVPFPVNEFGESVGYRTDHDPRKRATSAGPLTSREMAKALEKSVLAAGIPILENRVAVRLLLKDGRAAGVVCYNMETQSFEPFYCNSLVWATGGPANVYSDVSYPVSQSGMTGALLEAGAKAVNLTEWQYGLASVNPRWNVSGTYMQALPRIVSTRQNGKEAKEFLLSGLENDEDVLNCTFLKGYEWPFDARKAQNGSSRLDLLVLNELKVGRRVFLDYAHNPVAEDLDFERLSKEARDYLLNAGANQKTPFERLLHMNAPAVDFYRSHGIDLSKDLLEISLCAQHNNGGISVDHWWESDVPGLYVVGEAAGTHGIYRPGGSALNAGQVGAVRAARKISKTPENMPNPFDCEKTLTSLRTLVKNCFKASDSLSEISRESAKSMSLFAAVLRDISEVERLEKETYELLSGFESRVSVASADEIPSLLRFRDTLVTRLVLLGAMRHYAENGGQSRGGAVYVRKDALLNESCEETRFPFCDRIQVASYANSKTVFAFRPVKPIPKNDDFFENVWRDFRANLW